ncbi:sugar ABC transporter permease [soil metagenome]
MWRARPITWLFLAPAVVAILAVGLYPLLFALSISFRRYQLTKPYLGTGFIGFENYLHVLGDATFWSSLVRTFAFLGTVLPLELLLGLGVALLLGLPGFQILQNITRVALVIPLATTYAVVGLIGRLIFNTEFGVVNWGASLFGFKAVPWLGQPTTAYMAVAVMDIWQWTPFVALIFLAGLSAVPKEIEEAARLETGSALTILRYIQLPYLLPGLTAVLILRTADILKLFDMVFVMTRGGPGTATELISVYIQRIGFRVFDLGVASAMAIFLLILTIVLARLYIRVFYREVTT